jgi:hypothetical protein
MNRSLRKLSVLALAFGVSAMMSIADSHADVANKGKRGPEAAELPFGLLSGYPIGGQFLG